MRRIAIFLLILPCLVSLGSLADAGAPSEVPLMEVLALIEREYAHPERIAPRILLQGSLARAALEIPSFRFDLPPDQDLLRLWVGRRMREFSLPPQNIGLGSDWRMLLADIARFAEGALEEDTLPGMPSPSPGRPILTGLLEALDPHAILLDAITTRRLHSPFLGSPGQVGISLIRLEGDLTVRAVTQGTTADKAGVQGGDRVLQIGDRTALGMGVEEAESLLMGMPGSSLQLLLLRGDRPRPLVVTLRRVRVRESTVESHVFPHDPPRSENRGRLGYLRVISFLDSTREELWEHLQQLNTDQTPLRGLILDLRGNPGGVVEQAIRMADMFLERGSIATLNGPGKQIRSVRARWDRGLPVQPMVLLIDRETASAAELVAGALRGNRRALLIGEPSYGKGSVQSVISLAGGGALKLTVASFRTKAGPAGMVLGEGDSHDGPPGIRPHIRLRAVTPAAPGILGGGWRGLIPQAPPAGNPDTYPGFETGPVLAYLDDPAEKFFTGTALPLPKGDDARHKVLDRDYAIHLARRLLSGNHAGNQAGLFQSAAMFLNAERRRLDRALNTRLGSARMDWSSGAAPIGGKALLERVTLEVRPGKDAPWRLPSSDPAWGGIASGDHFRLTFVLRHHGTRPLHRVAVRLKSRLSMLDGLEIPVGRLEKGTRGMVRLDRRLTGRWPEGPAHVELSLHNGGGNLLDRADLYLPLQGERAVPIRIHLEPSGDQAGNGSGGLSRDMQSLSVRVENRANVSANAGAVWLSPVGRDIRLQSSLHPYPALSPGRVHQGTLPIQLDGGRPGDALSLRLHLLSEVGGRPHLAWSAPLSMGTAPDAGRLQASRRLLPPTRRAIVLEVPSIETSSPPRVDPDGRLILTGQALDEQGLREVQVFLNGHKQIYLRAKRKDRTRLPFQLLASVTPGRNLVRVVAMDTEGLSTERIFLIWHDTVEGFPIMGVNRKLP